MSRQVAEGPLRTRHLLQVPGRIDHEQDEGGRHGSRQLMAG